MARHKGLYRFSEDIWRSRMLGDSYTDLANKYQCSISTIRYHEQNIIKRIEQEHENGKTLEELARLYRVDKQAITNLLEDDNE